MTGGPVEANVQAIMQVDKQASKPEEHSNNLWEQFLFKVINYIRKHFQTKKLLHPAARPKEARKQADG